MNIGSAGLFTNPAGGASQAAVVHANGTLVSDADPAVVGETLQFFGAGLGQVNPGVVDGTAGPTNPNSLTLDQIQAYIDGQTASVAYSGLAPGFVGLYQLNLVVPSGISSGQVYVDVAGTDSYTSQAYIPVAPSDTTNSSIRKGVAGSPARRFPSAMNKGQRSLDRVHRTVVRQLQKQ